MGLFICRHPTQYARQRDTQTPLEPLFVALEHIEARGSLLLFACEHAQRVRLMKAMTETELVVWNAMVKKYQLTAFGLHRLAEYRGTTHLQSRAVT